MSSRKKAIAEDIAKARAEGMLKKQIEHKVSTLKMFLTNIPDIEARRIALMQIQLEQRTPRRLELQNNPHQQRRELAREQRANELARRPKKKKKPLSAKEFEEKLNYLLAKG